MAGETESDDLPSRQYFARVDRIYPTGSRAAAALGEGSVFPIHDQLDESMMNYMLTARHLGQSVIPEMMGGIRSGGLSPAALLVVPLYRFLRSSLSFCAVISFSLAALFSACILRSGS